MAIQSDTDSKQVTLTSGSEIISCPFYILEETHIAVIRTRNSVEEELTLNSEYTVSGEGDTDGFSVTMISQTIGDIITVVRKMPFTQIQVFKDGGEKSGPLVEKALDELTMQCQELRARLERALRFSLTNPLEDEIVHAPNTLIGFDDNGDITYVTNPVVSPGMVIAVHLADADYTRPVDALGSAVEVVYWKGSVEPNNAVAGDIWYDTTT